MRNNILLPTDFSDNAWSAAVYALELYAREECAFYFLHSTKIRMSRMSSSSNELIKVISENAIKELTGLKEMAEKTNTNTNTNHKFSIVLSVDDLKVAMETAIKEHNINLVVMGTKGTTKPSNFLFGSNTVHIVNKVRLCSILIVPDEFNFIEPKQIAFATDFNRFYSDKELSPLKKMARLYNSKIRVVCVQHEGKLSDIQEKNCTKLEEYLSNYKSSFHFMPNYAKKTVEINDFIKELSIDILAMVNYKHSFIENIIKEPVIKKIGFHPTIPFLVIPK